MGPPAPALFVHVGLNLAFVVPGETGGMETFVRALVPALWEVREDLRLTLICSPELADELKARPWAEGVGVVRLPVPGRSRVRRVLAEQTLVPVAARRAGVDVLHSPATVGPIRAGVPSVITLHDLIYASHPESHAGLLSYGMRVLVPLSARASTRLMTSSAFVRDEVVSRLNVPTDRIDVVPLGPGAESGAEPTPEAELRARHGLGEWPIVLSVSARRPHKNLDRLADAVRGLEQDVVLVLPGYAGPHDDRLRERGGDRVRVLGWVSDADLEGLYRAAVCMAFPSLYEGFGLPVVEAMRRGLPVACSGSSSLPEVTGDAALLFDPLDTASIADAIKRLLTDTELAVDLAERGRRRANRFSWERTAELCLSSYAAAVAAG